MKINELFEDGVITAYNTTVDVKPGETERQAAKLFPMNKDGKPKPLHSSAAKNSTPNKLFNLGLTENMSVTGTERRRLEKKKGIEIGTPEWFKHWFDLPYLREDINKQELLAKLKDQQRGRYIKAMLDAMHQLVQSKGARHSIGNYAYEIAKTFGYSPKDLEKMYRDTYDVPHDSMVRTEDVTQLQLNALEKAVDNVFGRIGIDVEFTRHFLDRANDERNGEPITIQELGKLFAKEYKRWGKPIAQMGPDTEAVMKDLESDINIPFALRWNGEELELIAKTVMRKKNFSTSNKQFPVENTQGSLAQKINWGGQNKPAKKHTSSKQQDMSWWQRLQQRAFGDADVNENLTENNINFTMPNFDFEWGEANKFEQYRIIGKEKWIELAKTGQAEVIDNDTANDIEGTDAGEDQRYGFWDGLVQAKKDRFVKALSAGQIELPIISRYSDGELEMIAGNTRLTGMMRELGKAKAWVYDVPDEIADLQENFANGKKQVKEALDNPYPFKLSGPTDSQEFSATAQTPNGVLRMDFETTDYDNFGIDFAVGKSMGKTEAGDEFRVFATVVAMMTKWINTVGIKHVESFDFGANKDEHASDGRAKLYTRFAKKLASQLSWKLEQTTTRDGGTAFFRLTNPKPVPREQEYWDALEENFADGKVKGKSRPGRVKRSGASCNGSVTELRAKAKKASGEKAKMYHWCANMKSGKKK